MMAQWHDAPPPVAHHVLFMPACHHCLPEYLQEQFFEFTLGFSTNVLLPPAGAD
jgi:hypothetical protein